MQCTVVTQQEDPLFFDREGLTAVASAAVVAEGLRAFKEHRVIAVDQDQGLLWAWSRTRPGSCPARSR